MVYSRRRRADSIASLSREVSRAKRVTEGVAAQGYAQTFNNAIFNNAIFNNAIFNNAATEPLLLPPTRLRRATSLEREAIESARLRRGSGKCSLLNSMMMGYSSGMPIKYVRALIPQAKKLRREMTPQERRLWYEFLANFSPRFQRQKTIGKFIADFYCYKAKLIVEVDGSQHYTETGLAYDAEREAILNGFGLHVIRFSNHDVNENFEKVCNEIIQSVQKRENS